MLGSIGGRTCGIACTNPVVFLNSEVEVARGSGEPDNPFQLVTN